MYYSTWGRKRNLRVGNLQSLVHVDDLTQLSDADLAAEWDAADAKMRNGKSPEDHDYLEQRRHDIEAEWDRREGPIQQENVADVARPTVDVVMRVAGISRSAANHRLRLGLPTELLLHRGRLPTAGRRGKLPPEERSHNGPNIRKYYLYQIAAAAAYLFKSSDSAADKMMLLRVALETAGVSLEDEL